jgi:cytochrome c-type biogenesis protein CcmH
LNSNIADAQAGLGELKRQLEAGEITPQAYAEQERDLAASLLESTRNMESAPMAGRGSRSKMSALVSIALMTSVVVVVAGGIYYAVLTHRSDAPGTAKTVDQQTAASAPDTRDNRPAHALSDEQLQRMVDQASSQVKSDPKDSAAWAMLAHSYEMLGKFAEATKAYAQLAKLLPKDAQVLADYADALAVANGRQLHGEPSELVNKALAIDAKNVKALVLAGSAALERSSYEEAVGYWERARSASTDPSLKTQIDASINDARLAAKGLAGTTAASAAGDGRSAVGAAGSNVAGRVILSDDLVGKAPPDATVFIFARPVSGSRMPVALVKRKVSDLPADFVLDDSNAMVRDMKLSQLSAVVIGARISMSGDVMPQPGDMQGWSAPVNIGAQGVKLEISEVLK